MACALSCVVGSIIAFVVNAQPKVFDSGDIYVRSRNPDGASQCADGGQNTTAEGVSLAQCAGGCRSHPSCLSYNYRNSTAFESKPVCEMFSTYHCYNLTADGCMHYQRKHPRPVCPLGCAICCSAYGQLMACRADGCFPGYVHDGVIGTCIDINECLSNPCMHGATCRDNVNYFSCACVSGYTGTRCETLVYVINLQVDDTINAVYFDGVLRANLYSTSATLDAAAAPSLVAIQATDSDGSLGGILASDNYGHYSDLSWKCTSSLQTNWYGTTFVDSGWPAAWLQSSTVDGGKYVWVQSRGTPITVYCRAHFV